MKVKYDELIEGDLFLYRVGEDCWDPLVAMRTREGFINLNNPRNISRVPPSILYGKKVDVEKITNWYDIGDKVSEALNKRDKLQAT